MTIKSSQELVNNALKEIKTLSADQALELVKENKCSLVDIRDIRELDKEGRIQNSAHIPRGMLEFWICLLYTSPSPRDRTRSRMPSSA